MPGTPSGENHSADSQKCGRNVERRARRVRRGASAIRASSQLPSMVRPSSHKRTSSSASSSAGPASRRGRVRASVGVGRESAQAMVRKAAHGRGQIAYDIGRTARTGYRNGLASRPGGGVATAFAVVIAVVSAARRVWRPGAAPAADPAQSPPQTPPPATAAARHPAARQGTTDADPAYKETVVVSASKSRAAAGRRAGDDDRDRPALLTVAPSSNYADLLRNVPG